MRRALNKASLIVVAVFALGLAGLWGWLVQSLPRTDGEMRVAGIDAPLNIKRTEHGLVTVQAEDWHDAWFGIGFAHAQDRLWQMESLRRFALGTLSEVIGEATLDLDIAQRRLNLDALARAQFEVLDTDTQTALRAYADGINAFVNNHDALLPPEFLVLQFRPAPWAPHHGLLWGAFDGVPTERSLAGRSGAGDLFGVDRYREAARSLAGVGEGSRCTIFCGTQNHPLQRFATPHLALPQGGIECVGDGTRQKHIGGRVAGR